MPFLKLCITSACLKLRPLETYIPDAFISIANISEAPRKDFKWPWDTSFLPMEKCKLLFQEFRLWGRCKEICAEKTARSGVGSEGEIPSSQERLSLPLCPYFFPFSNFAPHSTISKPETGYIKGDHDFRNVVIASPRRITVLATSLASRLSTVIVQVVYP